MIKLIHGDCLVEMKNIPDNSIDLILTDPPYGTTTCKWDSVIPVEPMWEQLKRIIQKNRSIILFCQQPFTSILINSNINQFKYMLYWRKSRPAGFVNANLKPLKDIEEIAIFSNGTCANCSDNNMLYNPQGLIEVNKKWKRPKKYGSGKGVNPTRNSNLLSRIIKFENYPRQVLDFSQHNKGQLHPTQKPVALLEYLIKTYTNKNEIVLDFTMGSGSTGIACKNTGRNFIGIEKDDKYFKIAKNRVKNHKTKKEHNKQIDDMFD